MKTDHSAALAGRDSVWKSRFPGLVLLVVSFLFLFARLGHYALWDDEALTSLVGIGIVKTGDTSVMIDHNIVAYRNGLVVKNGKDRATPPLCEYLTAPLMAFFPTSAFAARLPFAVLGWLTVLLGVIVLWRNRATPFTQWLVCLAVLGNISFFLYFRQCRYYGLVIFLASLIVVLYLGCQLSRRRTILWIAFLSVLLFASNYVTYVVLYVCLGLDYLLFRRKEAPLNLKELALLFVPQAIGCLLVALVWNPLNTSYGAYMQKNTPWDRAVMFLWAWRDMNQCEFFSGLLLAASLIAGIWWRDRWMIRAACAVLVYTMVLSAVSPQVRQMTSVADVRYFIPLLPLFIALQVRFLHLLAKRSRPLALGLAFLAFGTNLLNAGPLLGQGFRSTVLDYLGELRSPPPEPYTPVVEWVKAHVKPGQSILVYPDFMTYPLMFHAPQAVYAWQLQEPAPPYFANLPPIHFRGKEAPDYLIGFGPATGQMARDLQAVKLEAEYTHLTTIDTFSMPLYRPELFWRTFKPIRDFDRNTYAIHIFQRTSPPIPGN